MVQQHNGSSIPARIPAAVADQLVYCQRNVMNGYTHIIFELNGQVDLPRLKKAVRLLVDAEPILGCRFVDRWFRPFWERRDDISEMDWMPVSELDTLNETLDQLVEERRDPCVDPVFRLLVFQGQSDTLVIELCNICSDASGGIHIFRRLGEIYERLETDPDYRPAIGRVHDRSYRVIGKALGFGGRWTIVRNVFRNLQFLRPVGKWDFPVPESGPERTFTCTLTLPPERVRILSRYGRRNRASVNLILLTAIYRALKAEFCPQKQEPLLVIMPVSIRGFFPGKFDDIVTHFVGGTFFRGDGPADAPFEETLGHFREQFKSRGRNYLGLVSPSLLIETIAPLRWLFHLIPYAIVKRLVRRRTGRTIHEGGPGVVAVTSVDIDEETIQFAGHAVTSVRIGGNIPRIPGINGAGIIRVGDTVTISSAGFASCISPDREQAFLDRVLADLPAAKPTS